MSKSSRLWSTRARAGQRASDRGRHTATAGAWRRPLRRRRASSRPSRPTAPGAFPSRCPPSCALRHTGASRAAPRRAHEGRSRRCWSPPPAVDPGEVDDHLVSVLQTHERPAELTAACVWPRELRRERGTAPRSRLQPRRGDGNTMRPSVAGALALAQRARGPGRLTRPPSWPRRWVARQRGLSSYARPLDPRRQAIEGHGLGSPSSSPARPLDAVRAADLHAQRAVRGPAGGSTSGHRYPARPHPSRTWDPPGLSPLLRVVRANLTPREQVGKASAPSATARARGDFNSDDRPAPPDARATARRFRDLSSAPRRSPCG